MIREYIFTWHHISLCTYRSEVHPRRYAACEQGRLSSSVFQENAVFFFFQTPFETCWIQTAMYHVCSHDCIRYSGSLHLPGTLLIQSTGTGWIFGNGREELLKRNDSKQLHQIVFFHEGGMECRLLLKITRSYIRFQEEWNGVSATAEVHCNG